MLLAALLSADDGLGKAKFGLAMPGLGVRMGDGLGMCDFLYRLDFECFSGGCGGLVMGQCLVWQYQQPCCSNM